MALNKMNAILRLRKDNDFNYNANPSFKPANGEVCIVICSDGSTRCKVGDGNSVFSALSYSDWGIVVYGYYNIVDGKFYKEYSGGTFKDELLPDGLLYVNKADGKIYYHDESGYHEAGYPTMANAEKPGLVKLSQSWDGNDAETAVSQAGLKAAIDAIHTEAAAIRAIAEENARKVAEHQAQLDEIAKRKLVVSKIDESTDYIVDFLNFPTTVVLP